jgi:hypothetical protein
MSVSRKSKKNISKKRKNVKRIKKTRKHIRKMKGGGEIINDPIKGKYYNIIDSDVEIIKDPYSRYNDIYLSKNKAICDFIFNNYYNFNSNNEDLQFFKKAIDEKDKFEKNKLLDQVFKLRKNNIEKERLIKLPNSVYFRTPINNDISNTNCNNIVKFKLPKFDVRDNFLYLYKVVSRLELHNILDNGLHSKYGGVGGADRELNIKIGDRGKMYIGTSKDKTDYFMDLVTAGILIIIIIPVEMSYNINLSANFNHNGYMDTYFIGIILKQYIYIEIRNKGITKNYELTPENIKLALQNLNETYETYSFKKEIIESLTKEQIQSFTSEFLKLFSLVQIQSFTPEQRQFFLPEQLQGLTKEQLQILKPEQNNRLSSNYFSFEKNNY